MDSQIRLRQLNQPDISGYIAQVIPAVLTASGLTLSGGALIPSGSGQYDLGTRSRPFDNIYTNDINLPSGSGIHFGNVVFTAYYSGDNAVLNFGNYYITSSPVGLSIIGPSGAQGLSGFSGASGASGVSVTGIFASGTWVNFYTNDGRITNLALPSGASGASGVSVTGFYKSGNNWMFPQYSNQTTGAPIFMPSGAQGEQGPVGGITYYCDMLTGISGAQGCEPQATFYYVDPYTSINPKLNFVKGMRYTVVQSGIKLWTGEGNVSGQNLHINEDGITGYLRFALWDISLDPQLCNSTGRWNSFECADIGTTTDLTDYLGDYIGAWTDIQEDIYKRSISFNIAWNAQTGYRYGFVRCLSDGSVDDSVPGAFGCACGVAAVSLFGPEGPTGARGPQGIPGPQGQRGPAGESSPGIGIEYVEQGNYQIRFHYTDGTISDWIALPAGGAQGPVGATGPQGPSGVAGPIGPIGPSGDRYAAAFYTSNIWSTVASGTFQGIQKKNGGVDAWQLREGTGMWFYTGDMIWFRAESLVGLSYTPWQKILMSSPTYSTPRNFYADVVYYNSSNGEIQFSVSSTPTMPTYNPIVFTDYPGAVLVNLGGLGSPGPSGLSGLVGPTGPQGPSGASGTCRFNCSPLTKMYYKVPQNLDFSTYDMWDLTISGGYNIMSFDMSKWDVGKQVMIRVRNTGCYSNSDIGDRLMVWQDDVRFPWGDTIAPGPEPNGTCSTWWPTDNSWSYANLYSLVRLPNTGRTVETEQPDIMCTYAVEYRIPNVMYEEIP